MRRTPVQGRKVEGEPADADALEDANTKAHSPEAEGAERGVATALLDEMTLRQRGAWIVLAALALATAFAVIAVATLGDDSSAPSAPSNDVPDAASTTVVKADEREIVAAYLGYWKAQGTALEVADPDHPELALYTTGTQLQVNREAIQKVRDQGWATRTPANSVAEARVTVESIEGDHARFRSCELDDGIVVRAETGEPLGLDRGVGTYLWTGEMVRENGKWKVSEATRQQRWEGVAGCWLAE